MMVIRVDGGICSQINFITYGLGLAREGQCVKYDLGWFVENGRDLNGCHVRNWDMPKAFPGLEWHEATPDEIAEAKRTGAYFGGYPEAGRNILDARDALRAHFNPALDADNARRLDEILAGKSCAVHVRRGDLSAYDPFYGRPASVAYFAEAVRIIRALEGAVTFYFFSDDIAWVRENVLPALGDAAVVLCGENGSDRGYVDLYLMSRCDNVISSGGSLGVLAAVLSDRKPRLVLSRFRNWVCADIPRVIYLNDDVGCLAGRRTAPTEGVAYRKRGLYKPLYKIFRHLEKRLRTKRGAG